MKPDDLGTLFDTLADRGSPTVVHLSRPFDIAPHAGTRHDIERLARLMRNTAGRLAVAGARPGETVAVVKDNHWDYALLACAAVRIGAVPALLSGDLPPDALHTLLMNVRRHASATACVVHASSTPNGWEMTVRDDGVGFDTATTPLAFGLSRQVRQACHQLGLTVAIDSAPGEGTAVSIAADLTTPGVSRTRPETGQAGA